MSEDEERLTNEEIRQERRGPLIEHAIRLLQQSDIQQFAVVVLQENQLRCAIMSDFMFLSASSVRLAHEAMRNMEVPLLEFDLPQGPLS